MSVQITFKKVGIMTPEITERMRAYAARAREDRALELAITLAFALQDPDKMREAVSAKRKILRARRKAARVQLAAERTTRRIERRQARLAVAA